MITIKEEFLGSVKVQKAIEIGGFEVLALWLALKGYADAGLTGGFIPDEAVPLLPGVPRNWRKVAGALVRCGKLNSDGSRGAGLLHQIEHGWQLHDYVDHATPQLREEERRRKERERKAGWRDRSRGHGRDNDGTVPRTSNGTVPNGVLHNGDGIRPPGVTGTTSRAQPRDNVGDLSRVSAPAGDPSPAQPREILDTPPQRLGSSEREADPVGVGVGPDDGPEEPEAPAEVPDALDEIEPAPVQRIPCPRDLSLTDDQRKTLELLIPAWAVDELTQRFVGSWLADPNDTRTLVVWRKCLSVAIRGAWNNSRVRPKQLKTSPADDFDNASEVDRALAEAGIG